MNKEIDIHLLLKAIDAFRNSVAELLEDEPELKPLAGYYFVWDSDKRPEHPTAKYWAGEYWESFNEYSKILSNDFTYWDHAEPCHITEGWQPYDPEKNYRDGVVAVRAKDTLIAKYTHMFVNSNVLESTSEHWKYFEVMELPE